MSNAETPGERLEAALEMWEDGVQLMRENLRRRMPKATDDEIEAALDAWLCDRPPDAEGLPVPVPKAPRTELAATMEEVVAVLAQRTFAVVGSFAVSTHTEPSFTRHIEFVIAVESDEDAQQITDGMQRGGFLVDAAIEHPTSSRMATARLRRGPKSPTVDLLFAASGIEPEIASCATKETVLGQLVPVAAVGHLIAMKLVSVDDDRRLRDRADLLELSKVADDTEWARAEVAVRLIVERGFGRGRDLKAALEEWRAQALVIRSGA